MSRKHLTSTIFYLGMFLIFCGITSASDKGFIYRESVVDNFYQQIRQEGVLYEWEKEIVNFENEGMNLVCTLVIPKMAGKPPIAITLNGFGEDRHYVEIPETNGEHFYERVSRLLAEQGIATLRVDYRGSGDSDGTFDLILAGSAILNQTVLFKSGISCIDSNYYC